MKIIRAKKTINVWGTSNAWSLEPSPQKIEPCTECVTELEIQGDDKNGYNLVMTPEGFFTADYWYMSLQEAMESAEELFGVSTAEWS